MTGTNRITNDSNEPSSPTATTADDTSGARPIPSADDLMDPDDDEVTVKMGRPDPNDVVITVGDIIMDLEAPQAFLVTRKQPAAQLSAPV